MNKMYKIQSENAIRAASSVKSRCVVVNAGKKIWIPEKPFSYEKECRICSDRFSSWRAVCTHEIIEHNEYFYYCHLCKLSNSDLFEQLEGLNVHLKEIHGVVSC